MENSGAVTTTRWHKQSQTVFLSMLGIAAFYLIIFLAHEPYRFAYLIGVAAALWAAYGIYGEEEGHFSGMWLGLSENVTATLRLLAWGLLFFLTLFWMGWVDRLHPSQTTLRVMEFDGSGKPVDPAYRCEPPSTK